MLKKILITTICLALVPIATVGVSFGKSDLDDGISKFTDESMSADDSLGKADKNINFIVLKALTDAKTKQKKHSKSGGGKDSAKAGAIAGGGDYNENSVIVGPGSNTGDIYNIVPSLP